MSTLIASPLPFQDRIVLITGAGTGIGRAAARAFAGQGAAVVLNGRREAPLRAVAAELDALGAVAAVHAGDIADALAVGDLIGAVLDRFGRLDVAFNNAGIEGAFAPIEDLRPEDFDATIATNLKGVWLCCRAQIAAMRQSGRGGAIVNTSSWLAHGAFPGSSIYSASKAALDGMIRALAQETADVGIRINNVNPGIIDTPMFRRFADDAAARPFVDHTPMRRLGMPEDVADAVVWLCSDAARFVTGQNLLIDGGYTIPGHRAWLSGGVAPAPAPVVG
jgi:NAD(P)-dependent dehydrogenase (short-subunit alcohol dehydrogenase family)